MKYSLGSSNFLEEISRPPIVLFSSISLHCSLKKTFLYLVAVLWTLLSDGYIFLFLLCLSLLFFSQLFGGPPQTIILPFAFLYLGDGFDHCLLYNGTLSIRSNPLNLFVTSTV